jgi:hypothetical protein
MDLVILVELILHGLQSKVDCNGARLKRGLFQPHCNVVFRVLVGETMVFDWAKNTEIKKNEQQL